MSLVLPPPRFDDPAVFGRVAVLMGGTTSEREVSLDSGRNVLEALRARGVDANGVDGIPNLVRELQDKHFDRQESGAVFLNDAGRKQFLTAWQNRKREEIIHPFLKEKIMWGLVPYVQALLLARTLRGDTDGYPPFLWK